MSTARVNLQTALPKMAPTSVALGGKKRIVPGGTASQQWLFVSAFAVAVVLINHPYLRPAAEGGLRSQPLTGLVDEALVTGNHTLQQQSSSNSTAIVMDSSYETAKLQLLREENEWKNGLVLPSIASELPSYVQSWLRNLVFAVVIYLGVGGVWAYYIYGVFGKELFGSNMPSVAAVMEQIKVSMLALPLYSALPAFSEWMIEQGWTKAYPRVAEYGLATFSLHFLVYMTGVELGVYWMHRSLHFGPLYKALHYVHHIYNKENTLSPFAGLAFHPVDGILQAAPYVAMMFLVPMHALTHELLLFATAVWTANIHDCIHGRCEPIMGAGYHTIHHTNYKTNYGHYFVYMDWLFNSLELPAVDDGAKTS